MINLENQKVNHLAIIMDGNRRYAKKHFWIPWKGHDEGAETVNKLIDWCCELGIKELSLYALSTENLKRDKKEVDKLLELMKKWFSRFKEDKRMHEYRIKVRFIGDRALLPKDIQAIMNEIEEDSNEYDNLKINFCIAYGGRLELMHALNKLKRENIPITESNITKALWLSSEPDLVLRTGNVIRTSNFLPWQTTYSEWIFLEKLWPEFTQEDLISCLNEFEQRKRNFGK